MKARIQSIWLFLLLSCINPFDYQVPYADNLPITIDGKITNEPGPYQVEVYRSFDVQSDRNRRLPVSARRVSIVDGTGFLETLKEISLGIYQTNPTGIQGNVGGIYKLVVEFEDGRVYESIPDTLTEPGKLDSVTTEFNSKINLGGSIQYGFDVKASGRGNQIGGKRYKWDMTGTFASVTHPEFIDVSRGKTQCYPINEEGIPCNFYPPCTGLRNPAYTNAGYTDPTTGYRRVYSCTCCKCWYQLFNQVPILSDDLIGENRVFRNVPIYRVPLIDWYFMFRFHIAITQSTLTNTTYAYFKSIVKQKEAVSSLFQPVTGQIRSPFVQKKGEPRSINGIFYAAGISRKSKYLTRDDVKDGIPIPEVDFTVPGLGWLSCLELFPNATNVKPDFWVE